MCGILIGDFAKEAMFHTPWLSHKSCRPVLSTGAAGILACGEPIIKGKLLERALTLVLDANTPLFVALNLKDLFQTLSAHFGSVYKSICADVAVISQEFDTDGV